MVRRDEAELVAPTAKARSAARPPKRNAGPGGVEDPEQLAPVAEPRGEQG